MPLGMILRLLVVAESLHVQYAMDAVRATAKKSKLAREATNDVSISFNGHALQSDASLGSDKEWMEFQHSLEEFELKVVLSTIIISAFVAVIILMFAFTTHSKTERESDTCKRIGNEQLETGLVPASTTCGRAESVDEGKTVKGKVFAQFSEQARALDSTTHEPSSEERLHLDESSEALLDPLSCIKDLASDEFRLQFTPERNVALSDGSEQWPHASNCTQDTNDLKLRHGRVSLSSWWDGKDPASCEVVSVYDIGSTDSPVSATNHDTKCGRISLGQWWESDEQRVQGHKDASPEAGSAASILTDLNHKEDLHEINATPPNATEQILRAASPCRSMRVIADGGLR
eukprot:CAMPEP_0169168964 /NCGR_PEP_ID=MMETSP1015-20121227/61268_1 /TAXON_ID=342587 /ORGANISM="Karlodinium micrum, Strain CCMP2283" /LENGTH=345 /DNA_ID=CAMNT_0009241741 /DNA_START=56 /DNA_END=1093 /DNA_ORIENTATION=-